MFIKTNKVICSICLTFLITTTFGQIETNRKLEKLINKIEKQEFLFNNYELNKKSKKIANKLFEIANEDELIQISKMDCKLCFSFSFWVLSKKKSKLVNTIYEEYNKEENQKFVQLNKFKNHKGCVKIIYTEENFIYEVHKENKYLNEIK